MNNFTYRILLFSLGLSVIGFIVIVSLENCGSNEYMWIEVEDAQKISKGLQVIENNSASGGRAIVSKLGSHQTGAFAQYSLNLSHDGSYYVWSRVYWPGGCSNSFKLKIDNNNSSKIGNDNLLNVWHWIRCGVYNLKTSRHLLFLLNDENNAQIDRLLLTTDPYYQPTGKGEKSEYYSDFEEGVPECLKLSDSKKWKLVEERITGNHSYYISSNKSKKLEYALFNVQNSDEYSFLFSTKNGVKKLEHNAEILFDLIDEKNYKAIELNNTQIQLVKVQSGYKSILLNQPINRIMDSSYNDFNLIKRGHKITLKRNGVLILSYLNYDSQSGKIGFGSKTEDIYFDNIGYFSDLTPNFQEIFFYNSVERLKIGEQSSMCWKFFKGKWDIRQNHLIMSLQGSTPDNKNAFVITGKEFWQNYLYSVAVNTSEEAGLCFYVQDPDNYYLYKITYDTLASSNVKLVIVKNGKVKTINESSYEIKKGEWYRLSVRMLNDSIFTYIDNNKIFKIRDITFNDGKIGLWTHCINNLSYFNNVRVNSIKDQFDTSMTKEYNFEMRERAGTDFCDWENAGNIFIQKNSNNFPFLYINKKLCEESSMILKESISGDFKIDISHGKDIAQDICCNILIFSESKPNNLIYRFIIDKDKVALQKDDKIIMENIHSSNRLSYSLQLKGNSWLLKVGNQNLIECISNNIPLKMKVGLSYSGIGIGLIKVDKVKISIDRKR